MAGVIAMQKVEGSNPFSRFLPVNSSFLACQFGFSLFLLGTRILNQGRLFRHFRALVPEIKRILG